MHLCQYKQKIWQCEMHLAHTVCMQALKTIPLSLARPIKPSVSPFPCSTSQVPSQGTRERGWPSTAEMDAAPAEALATVQQITQLLLPTSSTTPRSISLMDSDDTSVVGTQEGSSSAMTSKTS